MRYNAKEKISISLLYFLGIQKRAVAAITEAIIYHEAGKAVNISFWKLWAIISAAERLISEVSSEYIS